MNVFFTNTATGSFGNKASAIYMPMEALIKAEICDKDYGVGLREWFLMFVLLSPNTPGHNAPERVMYKKNTKDLDQRLNVDFEAFKAGSTEVRQQLLYTCMLRSLDLMAEKKIPDFDAAALKVDVEAIAVNEGWFAAE